MTVPRDYWESNRAVIAESAVADLVQYVASEPPRGTYPNQWFLASLAQFDHLLFLHNDDLLCVGALGVLSKACVDEEDARVKIWFGRNHIMNQDGEIDEERTKANDRKYGKDGSSAAFPLWHWCLTESVPPNSFLVEKNSYTRHMQGPRDGNVGDWGFVVRLANAGAWGRFIAQYVSAYRVQASSVTNAGRGMDVHRFYELASQLVVPSHSIEKKRQRFADMAQVATVRYARDGERLRAWKCFISTDWTIRQRLSSRGVATALMLITPRALWRWAMRFQ